MNSQTDPSLHVVVIPLFGEDAARDVAAYVQALLQVGLAVVVVDNNPDLAIGDRALLAGVQIVVNRNCGGLAGGLNRGVELARQLGARWITLLDQDSRVEPHLYSRLRECLEAQNLSRVIIGPTIWDQQHQRRHGRWQPAANHLDAVRLLITSGTTFRAFDWPDLGCFHEDLFIDFVDYAWCSRARARGFALFQHPDVILQQRFGARHPSRFCRLLGMRLYSPDRHYFSLRNLRWLCLQPCVPLDLKVREVLKMLAKPWLWLLFEPQRRANLRAICMAFSGKLPAHL